mmetsp:Transcript_30878/g.71752  ORF Transcript_30878/g.71752 Transcript_30878/m.71752 type:complete len:288 (-) Transcript_30878:2952-3815(-)
MLTSETSSSCSTPRARETASWQSLRAFTHTARMNSPLRCRRLIGLDRRSARDVALPRAHASFPRKASPCSGQIAPVGSKGPSAWRACGISCAAPPAKAAGGSCSGSMAKGEERRLSASVTTDHSLCSGFKGGGASSVGAAPRTSSSRSGKLLPASCAARELDFACASAIHRASSTCTPQRRLLRRDGSVDSSAKSSRGRGAGEPQPRCAPSELSSRALGSGRQPLSAPCAWPTTCVPQTTCRMHRRSRVRAYSRAKPLSPPPPSPLPTRSGSSAASGGGRRVHELRR